MVLIDVGSVVVLATSHTTTTWMLSVFSDTTVTGGHVAAAVIEYLVSLCSLLVLVVAVGSRFRA